MAPLVTVPPESDFPLQNLPYGVFTRKGGADGPPRIGVALGDRVVDLAALSRAGLLQTPQLAGTRCFEQASST